MTGLKLNFLRKTLSTVLILLIFSIRCDAFSGNYLSALVALKNNDFEKAASSYALMLESGITDEEIIQNAIVFSIIANNFDLATQIKDWVDIKIVKAPASHILTLANGIKTGDYDGAKKRLTDSLDVYPEFVKILLLGWCDVANNKINKGIEKFGSLGEQSEYLSSFNIALAYAMKGDFGRSEQYLNQIDRKNNTLTDRQFLAQVQIYSQNDKNDFAIELIEERSKTTDGVLFLKELRELKLGTRLSFDSYKYLEDAFADVFYLMGTVGNVETKSRLAYIFYTQLAKHIAKDKNYYDLKVAQFFDRIGSYQVALRSYERVTYTSPFFLRAQLGRTNILIDNEQTDDAVLNLEKLLDQGFKEFVVYNTLATIFRGEENYNESIKYYNFALESYSKDRPLNAWATFFLRGITYDRSGRWLKAKADFDIALELYPNHPEVLNYLGYSLIERNENLDQALGMIKNAIKQKPESGYILDSLAWGLFRLGRYEESIIPMEKAIKLEPHDPIINDHFGDILWMIGRKREANFQWKRALLFGPTLENKKKIEQKLKSGIIDL